jgi:hypothetical protein
MALASAGIVLLYILRQAFARNSALPPGPAAWPVIGNLLDLKEEGWCAPALFRNWGRQFGEYATLS